MADAKWSKSEVEFLKQLLTRCIDGNRRAAGKARPMFKEMYEKENTQIGMLILKIETLS